MKKPNIDPSWLNLIQDQFKADYMQTLRNFLQEELRKYTVYPKMTQVFNAFLYTPFNRVKVVILGQDPYHNAQQAHGLCFSVENTENPPSLINIFKEIKSDLGIDNMQQGGNLTHWARQGVFLLNTVLTVRAHQAASHREKGWEQFTDQVIRLLDHHRKDLVFLLWGSFAHKKKEMINHRKHYVLQAPHPSPLSAHRGFFGCKHFSQTNQFLNSKGLPPIDWGLGS